MTQSSGSTLGLATVVLQQLQAVLALSAAPCLGLSEQVASLTARFLSAPITPTATLDFENDLGRLLDECGRLIVQALFNHIEPANAQDSPKHLERDRQDYCRKNLCMPIEKCSAVPTEKCSAPNRLPATVRVAQGPDSGRQECSPTWTCGQRSVSGLKPAS
jgi:hypothetical protein